MVKSATATVDGKSETILVDGEKGMTLYLFTPDKGAGKVTCTGGCLAVWPPLEAADGSTKPTAGPGVSGTLATIMDPNNKPQLTYNGWPLYFYVQDKNPGDTKGQNVGQKWFVVTPDQAPNS
jgi:predicted lipoprotein with Yx(FWY)xxD motif